MVSKVTVYGTTHCPWCHRTREFLKKHKIKFKDVNIEKDEKYVKYIIEKSGQQGVPVIEIDDKVIVGFDEKELKKALKIK